MKSIYGYDFADDGTGNFIRLVPEALYLVWCRRKTTITLAGNAELHGNCDSSGQMVSEGSDGSKVQAKLLKISGDYSSFKYKFWRNGRHKQVPLHITSLLLRANTRCAFCWRLRWTRSLSIMTILRQVCYIAKSPDGYLKATSLRLSIGLKTG